MKIIIENEEFDFNTGCGILKLKHEKCPFPKLKDIWDDIQPLKFSEIAKIENIEKRRIAILALGIERLVKEVEPELIDSKTINKETTWVNKDGELEHIKFNDTYELYQVHKSYFKNEKDTGLRASNVSDCYYIKCKDTSTNREYLLWVDIASVIRTNNDDYPNINVKTRLSEMNIKQLKKYVNAIDAIAWTIQTDVKIGNIEKIIRQGDCVLVKPKDNYEVEDYNRSRHLTGKEYLELLVAES